MPRVKRGVIKNKRRRKVLSQTKGYRFGRSTKEAAAKEAILHAGSHAFAHRKDKKADKRALWQTNIGAGSVALGISYSKLMGALKAKKIMLDRKILANLAKNHPAIFEKIVKAVM